MLLRVSMFDVSKHKSAISTIIFWLTCHVVVDTKAEFFTLLEVGMACIAVNLPSLWFLVSKVTPESVLRSIRSMISLASIRSGGSNKSYTRQTKSYPTEGGEASSASSTSRSHLAGTDEISTEMHTMYNPGIGKSPPLPETVHVTKSFSQTEDYV
jgi:hypothetical protein